MHVGYAELLYILERATLTSFEELIIMYLDLQIAQW